MTSSLNKSYSPLLSICVIVLFIAVHTIAQTTQSLPTNITDTYKGTWHRVDGSLYDSVVTSGLISVQAHATERIFQDYHFVQGRVGLRDGIYLHNRFFQYMLHGVYALRTGHVYFVMVPPSMLFSKVAPSFNDSGAQLAYEVGMQKLIVKLIQQQLSGKGPKTQYDPSHKCMYRGDMIASVVKQDKSAQVQDPFIPSPVEKLIAMSGSVNSVNCNSTMSMQLETWIADEFYSQAANYTLMVSLVAIAEVLVLIYQMGQSKTQTTAARVSLLMLGMQAMLDTYFCLMHLTVGIYLDGAFKAFATAAFLKFVLFAMFEMRYLLFVWKSRRPQAFSQGWAAMRRELQNLYTRFYGGLFIGLLLMYQLNFLFQYFLFVLYAFWAPQIYCNLTRNSPKPLHPLYIVVTSVGRLAIPIYLFGFPDNFVGFQPNPLLCLLLALWVMAQALFLLLQHYFGPRFFIPKFFLPPKYDYRRPIPPEQMEDGECNCVICMQAVDDSDCMVTPCNHVFHSACLQRWMEEKMECPSCRHRPLPEL